MGCPCIGLAPWEEKPNSDENRPNKSLAPCRVALLEVSDSLACRPPSPALPARCYKPLQAHHSLLRVKMVSFKFAALALPIAVASKSVSLLGTASVQLVDFRTSLRPDAITILGPSETDFW